MNQLSFFEPKEKNLVNLKEASRWASQYLNRNITISNISYLLQYGRVKKYVGNGNILLSLDELKEYYDSFKKENHWKKILGEDLNWQLSFAEYKEAERTKHVHILNRVEKDRETAYAETIFHLKEK